MAKFMGFRVNRGASGAGAGRGDNPHAAPRPRPMGTPFIGGTGAQHWGPSTQRNPVPNTRAARKANSPKAKARALKAVNKKPFGLEEYGVHGLAASDAELAYQNALLSQDRLMADRGNYEVGYSYDDREHDDNIVGAYIATGKSLWSNEGQKWMKKNRPPREDNGGVTVQLP